MRLIADEGVDQPIVSALRKAGFEVAYIAELAPSVSDEFVLHQADESGALLVTTDKDFGEMVFRQQRASHGVLLLRLSGLATESKIAMVLDALEQHGDEMFTGFSVLSPGTLRIRPMKPAFPLS